MPRFSSYEHVKRSSAISTTREKSPVPLSSECSSARTHNMINVTGGLVHTLLHPSPTPLDSQVNTHRTTTTPSSIHLIQSYQPTMCFYDIIHYSCSAETATLVESCILQGFCLPHMRRTLHTTAACDLCAESYRWNQHFAVMLWLTMERERLENIAEDGLEEAIEDEDEVLAGSTDDFLGADQAECSPCCDGADQADDEDEGRIQHERSLGPGVDEGNGESGLRTRRTTF